MLWMFALAAVPCLLGSRVRDSRHLNPFVMLEVWVLPWGCSWSSHCCRCTRCGCTSRPWRWCPSRCRGVRFTQSFVMLPGCHSDLRLAQMLWPNLQCHAVMSCRHIMQAYHTMPCSNVMQAYHTGISYSHAVMSCRHIIQLPGTRFLLPVMLCDYVRTAAQLRYAVSAAFDYAWGGTGHRCYMDCIRL